MSARYFVRKEIESLVLFYSPANGNSSLYAGISRIRHCTERVDSLEFPIAQVSENISMEPAVRS